MGGRISGGARSEMGIPSLPPRGLELGRLFAMTDGRSVSAAAPQCGPLAPFTIDAHRVAPSSTDPTDKFAKSYRTSL